MGQAFWENGCTTPPFFEACPTLGSVESSIPHGAWRFLFFSNFLFAKIIGHLDLHIHCWDFNFIKKRNQKKFHKNC
jgi:hypothetical protein